MVFSYNAIHSSSFKKSLRHKGKNSSYKKCSLYVIHIHMSYNYLHTNAKEKNWKDTCLTAKEESQQVA